MGTHSSVCFDGAGDEVCRDTVCFPCPLDVAAVWTNCRKWTTCLFYWIKTSSPPFPLRVCVCVCARYSTPWLRCGSRKHRRWTPVSSITAGRTSATCSTSGTWCWGECTRMLLTLALKTDHMLTSWPVYVSHYRFDFANSNVNDENLNKMNPHHVPDVVRLDSSVNKPGCPCSSSYCWLDEHWPPVAISNTK